MTLTALYQAFIVTALITANLPWLSGRFLLFIAFDKNAWWRWLEWLVYYLLTGLLAWGLEFKLTGMHQSQDWEFYVTTLCLFGVFALPGFIYHYDLRKLFAKSSK
ncbi:DUF2818 family protein [Methylomarinum sp. Ch1-1]|uniref:DUF2818 family protein n=1 Tax=Methylomarinum roseum TaxID=3067653 RepID=A0AAU7NRQ7_9GAMM|nr:DUF2818 family protein [Methylomarinum sp. Ch1-1]MDP4520385.1 DUF2818 family protein [Methylomarinum sp. Ch1-1]